jgi:hypothetical protein
MNSSLQPRVVHHARPTPVFEFEALSAMPCGCVTAAYRAVQWEVSLVSVEAKGPYCHRATHFVGQVIELGDACGLDQESEVEEEEEVQ